MKLADPVEEQMRSPFQREVAKLYQRVILYDRIKASVNIEDSPDFLAEVLRLQQMLPAWAAALRSKQAGQPFNEEDVKMANAFLARFQSMSEFSDLLAIPPASDDAGADAWQKAGDSLLQGEGKWDAVWRVSRRATSTRASWPMRDSAMPGG